MSTEQPYVQGEIDDLLNVDHGLSAWELKFLESVKRRVDGGHPLTTGQLNKLGQIWDKHCK